MVLLSGLPLTQGGIEGTREERRHQREGCMRGEHLPRAHGVGLRSLIAPGPDCLAARARANARLGPYAHIFAHHEKSSAVEREERDATRVPVA